MTLNIKELERLLKTFNDEDSINIATPRLRRILARLKAAEEERAALEEAQDKMHIFVHADWSSVEAKVPAAILFGDLLVGMRNALKMAEAALIRSHEGEGNE